MRRTSPAIHPAVSPTSTIVVDGRGHAYQKQLVTCPSCRAERWRITSAIKKLIARGEYTGRCKTCAVGAYWAGVRQPPVVHPALSSDGRVMRLGGRGPGYCQKITCPGCGASSWQARSHLAAWVAAGIFTGLCMKCGGDAHRLRHPPKTVLQSGYVAVAISAVAKEDLSLYRAMRAPHGGPLGEHRWVMAKHLGRPLLAWELVDHMDGDKQNNDISNLRIYVKGKNQPGSHNGYGTYYDEWQRAEASAKQLETEAARLRELLLLACLMVPSPSSPSPVSVS